MSRRLTSLPIAALIVILATACSSLPPVKNEVPLTGGDLSIQAASTNDTKVVIFNTSNSLMFGIDGSGRINVLLNGKGVTQLNIGQYAQLILPRGNYQLGLVHRDLKDFESQHQVELVNPESFVEVYATVTSNQAKVISALPEGFVGKFKPVN